jgi:hypothetical protein
LQQGINVVGVWNEKRNEHQSLYKNVNKRSQNTWKMHDDTCLKKCNRQCNRAFKKKNAMKNLSKISWSTTTWRNNLVGGFKTDSEVTDDAKIPNNCCVINLYEGCGKNSWPQCSNSNYILVIYMSKCI